MKYKTDGLSEEIRDYYSNWSVWGMHLERHPVVNISHNDKDIIILEDVGPWDNRPTITNDIEYVIARLYAQGMLNNNKRLLYVDSENILTEVVHFNEKFIRFEIPNFRADNIDLPWDNI